MNDSKKMPLDFLANAIDAAKNQLSESVSSNTVSSTKTYTVFQHENKIVVALGNLHEKVEAPFCIEFDLRYDTGFVSIVGQRIY